MKIKTVKRRTIRSMVQRNARIRATEEELRIWDEAAPVGREFGSPDFERLMEEDWRNGVGVFDPAVVRRFGGTG